MAASGRSGATSSASWSACTWRGTRWGSARAAPTNSTASILAAYRAALIDGKARWIERRTAGGVIGELLVKLERRTQADLLAKRTIVRKGKRRLRTDSGKALALPKEERARVVAIHESASPRGAGIPASSRCWTRRSAWPASARSA